MMLINILSRYLLADKDVESQISEGFLQDPSDSSDEDSLMAEIAAQICFELAYGPPSPLWLYGFLVVENILSIPCAKQWLHNLGRDGVLIKDMAIKAFRL
jgi:hypothetical protein